MATFAIGDIHGNRAALDDLLAQVVREAAKGDTVVFLGDYIDRGPDSKGCIDAILEFRGTTRAEVIGLLGNHEDWLLRTRDNYCHHSWLLGMEGLTTIRSYSQDAEHVMRDAMSAARSTLYRNDCELPYGAFFASMPAEHIQFLETLRTYHRTRECICAHGGLDPGVARIEDQIRHAWIWGKGTFPEEYEGTEIVVYGHHDNAALLDGWPRPMIIGSTIGVDTISHGILTAVQLPGGRLFQSARHERGI